MRVAIVNSALPFVSERMPSSEYGAFSRRRAGGQVTTMSIGSVGLGQILWLYQAGLYGLVLAVASGFA
jgi:hypothetical protein